MSTVISLQNVTKYYGKSMGVQDVTLEVPKGTVFGFLGPNGAGKSTTINMLIDFIRPTEGKIAVFGLDSVEKSVEIRRRVGFLAGDFALDKKLTGWQQLEYFGNLRGQYDKKYVRELAKRLDCNLNKHFGELSRGNKQKVGLITALMHKPELLIFDEPTSGLDPLMQAEFNKIILEQKQRGATTFISSHVLSEVQEICDHVAFIREGRMIASKPLAEIINTTARMVTLAGVDKAQVKALQMQPGVSQVKSADHTVNFHYAGDVNILIKLLAGLKLKDVTIRETDLEAIFMQYYEADHV